MTRTLLLPVSLTFALLLATPVLTLAAPRDVEIHWLPPGDSDVAGYEIYIGDAPGQYNLEASVPENGLHDYTFTALDDATAYYVSMRAYDFAGNRSVYAEEVTIPRLVNPPAPDPDPPAPDPDPPAPDPDPPAPDPDPPAPDPDPPAPTPPPAPNPLPDPVLALRGSMQNVISAVGMDGSLAGILRSLHAADDLRPARCDLDGDGDHDFVVGFGPGSANMILVAFVHAGSADSSRAIPTGTATYAALNGETFPSCGDVDGDGRDEIVIGFGARGGGYIQVLDDALANFAALDTTYGQGFVSMGTSAAYNVTNGTSYPAVGDFDGDGLDEIAVGLGVGGGGALYIRDDATTHFTAFPTALGGGRFHWTAEEPYVSTNGTGRPAAGDIDGDGLDELVIGLGAGGNGEIFVLDDAGTSFAPYLGTPSADGWITAGWAGYNAANGATIPSVGDPDFDGYAEIAVSFGPGGNTSVLLLDDPGTGFAAMTTPSGDGFLTSTEALCGLLAPSDVTAVPIPTPLPPEPPAPPVEPPASFDEVAMVVDAAGNVSTVGVDASSTVIAQLPAALAQSLRPAWCDVDGDGDNDLVAGFGPGSGGSLMVLYMQDGLATGASDAVVAGSAAYNATNGETYPGCGDFDGDGIDELVVGFGPGGAGQLRILDDANAGFMPLQLFGWIHTASLGGLDDGSRFGAGGDFDGDGADEIVIGYGSGGGGWVAIRDDALRGFGPYPTAFAGWVPWNSTEYASEDGSARPAAGDIDGDGRDEIVIGLGPIGEGEVFVLDDALAGFAPYATGEAGWLTAGEDEPYEGPTIPSVADFDGDGEAEIVIGFTGARAQSVLVLEDASHGFGLSPRTPSGDGWVHGTAPLRPAAQ